MHQPCYKDASGEYIMPWVFTHAIKDYFDMPYTAVNNNVKATFNLVPSLIVQLKDYSDFDVNDRFLKYIKKKERSEYEKEYIFDIIKSTSFSLINKFPRFKELLNQPYLNMDSMNDLEVFFLLSHCGDYLQHHSDTVKNLMRKTTFLWEEKIALIGELHEFISKILPFYKDAFINGSIELSTTPFYHPILPLLLNVNAAEQLEKPRIFADFKADAKKQIEMAMELFENEFGKKPFGLWPSEGSVSAETLDLIDEFGLSWVATDEDILHKTNPSYTLNKRYFYKNLTVIFRNKTISDRIGFMYRYLKTDDAIVDLKKNLSDTNMIIMDGENAWEYYSNPAEFLNAFYKEVGQYEVLTMNEFARNTKLEAFELDDIASGSWIGADFAIWMGDSEKNRAWEILSRAKSSLGDFPNEEAYKLLLIDEGSDWFWWYGQTNYTKHKKLYDYLFKSRIAEVYKLLNKPLDEIYSFIIEQNEYNRAPVSYIKADIDGRETFFEYANAGYAEIKSSAIHTQTLIKGVKYGYDERSNLYLAIFSTKLSGIYLRINSKVYDIKRGVFEDYAVDKIIEIKMPFCDNIKLEVLKDGVVVQEIAFEIKKINFTWIA